MSIRLSWTRFLSYSNCKLQYHLRYERKVKRPRPQQIFLVGSVVHRAIDEWAKTGFESGFMLKRVVDIFNAEAKSVRFQDATRRVGFLQRAVRGVLLAENVYNVLEIPKRNAEVERRFNIPLGRGTLIGDIDVYDPAEGGTIYDLKMYTSNSTPDPRQVLTYSLAKIAQHAPVEQVGFITPFLGAKVRKEALSMERLKEQKEALELSMLHMEKGVEPVPTKGSHCTFCEYRAKPDCPATYTPVEAFAKPAQRSKGSGRRLARPK